MRNAVSKSGHQIFMFDSVAEVMDYIDGDEYKNVLDYAPIDRGMELNAWSDVVRQSKEKWDDGIKILESYIEDLRNVPIANLKSIKRKVVYGTTGDELDMEKLLAGDPNCWISHAKDQIVDSTTATICTDIATPYNVSARDVLWRGAAALALLFILEEKGYACELWVVAGSHPFEDSPGVIRAVCLKRPQDPADKSTLINTVSGWYYRSALFSLSNTLAKKNNQTLNPGYGSVFTPTAYDLDEISKDQNRVLSSGVYSKSGAYDMIVSEIQRIAPISVTN